MIIRDHDDFHAMDRDDLQVTVAAHGPVGDSPFGKALRDPVVRECDTTLQPEITAVERQ